MLLLGVQWSSTVSHVLWDIQLLTIEFTKNQQCNKLYHNSPVKPFNHEVSLHRLDKELSNSHLGLFLYSMEDPNGDISDLVPFQLQDLQLLIVNFEDLFGLPSQVPHSRMHDHYIPLEPGAKLPNIQPYHYGPFCKRMKSRRPSKNFLLQGSFNQVTSPFHFMSFW